jgi:hypothetical protein
MSALQAPVALFPHNSVFDRPTSYYCWSRHVERVDRSRVWYPLAHDITTVPAVHLDSDLGQLSRWDHGLYDYLWIAVHKAEMGRVFTGNVHLPYVDSHLAPIKLWRAVNAGGNGLCARGNMWQQGWGIPINTANFQLRLENHFNWRHPDRSPVISCTAEKGFAQNLCRRWLESGDWCSNEIMLLEIDCHALLSDPGVKVWKQEDIVNAFRLDGVQPSQHEYIVLSGIAKEHCEAVPWD